MRRRTPVVNGSKKKKEDQKKSEHCGYDEDGADTGQVLDHEDGENHGGKEVHGRHDDGPSPSSSARSLEFDLNPHAFIHMPVWPQQEGNNQPSQKHKAGRQGQTPGQPCDKLYGAGPHNRVGLQVCDQYPVCRCACDSCHAADIGAVDDG